jgi:hypothetical protein
MAMMTHPKSFSLRHLSSQGRRHHQPLQKTSPKSIDEDININHIPLNPIQDTYVLKRPLNLGQQHPAFTWDLTAITTEVGHEYLLLDQPDPLQILPQELLVPA